MIYTEPNAFMCFKASTTISQHTIGHAADIVLEGIPNRQASLMIYSTMIFNRVNWYKSTPQGIHVDMMNVPRKIYLVDWKSP